MGNICCKRDDIPNVNTNIKTKIKDSCNSSCCNPKIVKHHKHKKRNSNENNITIDLKDIDLLKNRPRTKSF